MRNAYRMLLDLLPDPPLQVGVILSVDNGVATIELPGGGRTTARGPGATGDKVFFRDQVIEGAAANLPIEIITV